MYTMTDEKKKLKIGHSLDDLFENSAHASPQFLSDNNKDPLASFLAESNTIPFPKCQWIEIISKLPILKGSILSEVTISGPYPLASMKVYGVESEYFLAKIVAPKSAAGLYAAIPIRVNRYFLLSGGVIVSFVVAAHQSTVLNVARCIAGISLYDLRCAGGMM